MKVLVIYYSQSGKTKRLAEEIAKNFKVAGNEVELASIEPSGRKGLHYERQGSKRRRGS